MADTPPLRRLKSGALARGMALAKLTVTAGARAAGHAVGSVFGSEADQPERSRQHLQAQLASLSQELGQLKGSMMKAGQMLSVLGEYFLPPEANTILKSLQSQSAPMHWDVIEAQLRNELSAEVIAELEIDPKPLAAASLGQVHRATRKSDGAELAVKVQYPGVEAAIASDLRSLRTMLNISRLLPRGPDYDVIFAEVKEMLEQEADYCQELVLTNTFASKLAGDSRYVVPKTFPRYSSKRILTTSFEQGVAVDSPIVQNFSQGRRDALGAMALDLYMRELWQLGMVQTDPHFGNYRVRVGNQQQPDQLVLLDFGATRLVPEHYLVGYRDLVMGSVLRDADTIVRGGVTLTLLNDEDGPERKAMFVELCELICEPFATANMSGIRNDLFDAEGKYSWGASDLPKRVAKRGTQMVFNLSLRTPPREAIFLDRKLGGTFIFLSALKVCLNGRDILGKYLPLERPSDRVG